MEEGEKGHKKESRKGCRKVEQGKKGNGKRQKGHGKESRIAWEKVEEGKKGNGKRLKRHEEKQRKVRRDTEKRAERQRKK